MGRLNAILTPDDLKKGDKAEPGWHLCEFTKYEEEDADTDKSLNIFLTFKIVEDGKDNGKQARKLFNEKALGFGKALWKTWGFPYDEKSGLQVTSDMIEAKLNTRLKVYFKIGKSTKGNEYNDATDFLPA